MKNEIKKITKKDIKIVNDRASLSSIYNVIDFSSSNLKKMIFVLSFVRDFLSNYYKKNSFFDDIVDEIGVLYLIISIGSFER